MVMPTLSLIHPPRGTCAAASTALSCNLGRYRATLYTTVHATAQPCTLPCNLYRVTVYTMHEQVRGNINDAYDGWMQHVYKEGGGMMKPTIMYAPFDRVIGAW